MERKMNRTGKLILTLAMCAAVSLPLTVIAHGGGGPGMGGSGMGGGGMMGSSGMLVVADDGSLLVLEMDASGMMDGGGGLPIDRALVNLGPDGAERWRATFTDGWPMMPVTQGDLVVVALMDDNFMGDGGGGDGDMGDGHGDGGMMGVRAQDAGHGNDSSGDEIVVVGLDLATGQELWRTTVTGDMGSAPQFAPDGSRFYFTVVDVDMGGMSDQPMEQGRAPGAGMSGTTSVVAVDRNGTVLWTTEVGSGDGGGMAAGR